MRLVTPLLMLLALALALSPSASHAQPIRIAFDDCPGGPAATTQKSDECASNTGSAMNLVVSFMAPLDPTQLLGITAEMDAYRNCPVATGCGTWGEVKALYR